MKRGTFRSTGLVLVLVVSLALVARFLWQDAPDTPAKSPPQQNASASARPGPDGAERRDAMAPQSAPAQSAAAGALSLPPGIAAATPESPAMRLAVSAPESVKVGDVFDAAISVDTSAPVNRYTLDVGFDPLALKSVSANAGNFMQQGSALAKLTQTVVGEGKLLLEVEQDGGSGVEGAGNLAVVQFQAIAPGTAEIRLRQIEIFDGRGNPLPATKPAPATVRIQN